MEQLFRRLDRNGDGLLNTDEMPAALRAQLEHWDRNRDELIDPQEFKQFAEERMGEVLAETIAQAGSWEVTKRSSTRVGPAHATWSAEQARTPARADNGTPLDPLPPWVEDIDGADDELRALIEWQAGGRSPDDSRSTAPNQESFRTAQQLLDAPPARSEQPPATRGGSAASDMNRGGSAAGELNLEMRRGGQRAGRSPNNASASATHRSPRNAALPAALPATPAASRPPTSAAPAPAPSAAAARTPAARPNDGQLATTPSPIGGTSNAYWSMREAQNEMRAALGHAPILFLGDSITDWFAIGPGKPVWDAFLAPLGAENFAVASSTTSQVLWQVENGQAAAMTPDIVVLMIGTNNPARGQSPLAVAEGIAKIVSEIEAQMPRTNVLLLGILPRGRSPADPLRAAVSQVNDFIATLHDGKRVHFLDLGRQFLQPDGTIAPAVMADALHPTLFGYQILTASIWGPLHQLAAGK